MPNDITRLLKAAERYGIKVYLTPSGADAEERAKRSLRGLQVQEVPEDLPFVSDGPQGHYLSVPKRTVWFDHLHPKKVATHLHELCHVLLTPPGIDIDAYPEDALLLPFERVLAKTLFSKENYKRVLQWQQETVVDWFDEETDKSYAELGDVPNLSRHPYWRASLKTLEKLGVLDQGKVTWKKPTWKKLPKKFRDYVV